MQAGITRLPRTDWFGPRRVSYLVINTNGEIDVLDHLKVIGDGSDVFRGTATNLFEHSLSEAEESASEQLQRYGATVLPTGCKSCDLRDVCAGGYLPHRYSSAALFNNPSVACTAIQGMFKRLIPILKSKIS